MTTNNGAETLKAKRVRSPAYPGITLEEALIKAEIIRKAEGKNEASVNTILSHWNYSPKSGAGLVALSALVKFGLLSDNGVGKNRRLRLTDLALKILLDDRPDSSERLALMREAALTPSIHKELWDKYQGALPSDLNLRFCLRTEKRFQDNAADELIKEFRKTLDFTKLGESAIISPKGEEKPDPEGELEMPDLLTDNKHGMAQGQEKKAETSKQDISNLQRTTKQMPIPLTNAPWGVLQLPYPMTEEDWQEFEEFLSHMKGPLTGTRKQKVSEE